MEQAKRSAFDVEIKRRLGDSLNLPEKQPKEAADPFHYFDFEDEADPLSAEQVIPAADAVDATGKPINQQSIADLLINAEVLLGHDDSLQMARVL